MPLIPNDDHPPSSAQPQKDPVHGETPTIRCRLANPRVLSRDELRTLDRTAVDELGLPSILLMENAAIGTADAITSSPASDTPPVLIIAGGGNNGGDGLALARQLHIRGVNTAVLLFADRRELTPDSKANLNALRKTEIPLHDEPVSAGLDPATSVRFAIGDLDAGIVVDALFGTGLTRPIEGPLAEVVEAVNAVRAESGVARVIALDLPSGLDADTGRPLGATVRADLTVTFAALKTGFFSLEAQPYLGTVELVPIGVPPEITRRFGAPSMHGSARHARRDAPDGDAFPRPSGSPGRDEPTARGPADRPR